MLDALKRNQGRGPSLPDDLSATASRALGRDLTDVRVHTDRGADVLARSVQAVAFTHGQDIYFSEGSYRPAQAEGKRLIAHELGHVGQSTTGSGCGGTIGRVDDPAERAADHAADGIIEALRRPTVQDPIDHDHHDDAGGNQVHRSQTLRRKKPVKVTTDPADTTYQDDEYPDVKLEKLTNILYRILTGPLTGTEVTYQIGEGYELDLDGSPFLMRNASVGNAPVVAVAAQDATLFDHISASGQGVSSVRSNTTLRTMGAVTCVPWLLYNETAAFMAHIVVKEPLNCKSDGIQQQVDALFEKFKTEAGSSPTTVVVKVNSKNPSYMEDDPGEGRLEWMNSLKPTDCSQFKFDFGYGADASQMVHVVQAVTDGRPRKEWTGSPVTVLIK